MVHSSSEAAAVLDQMKNFLRERREQDPSFSDIVTLAEVMAESLQAFFKTMDTAIYRELATIAEFIAMMRSEIGGLQVSELSGDRIPAAGRELDAIVKATEGATNTIMGAAEAVLAADPSDPVAYKAFVDENMFAIFEACSFQDITGQRVSKVVETLCCIERRVARFSAAIPESLELPGGLDVMTAEEISKAKRKEDMLLNGPALDGQGIDQDMVDALLGAAFGDTKDDKNPDKAA